MALPERPAMWVAITCWSWAGPAGGGQVGLLVIAMSLRQRLSAARSLRRDGEEGAAAPRTSRARRKGRGGGGGDGDERPGGGNRSRKGPPPAGGYAGAGVAGGERHAVDPACQRGFGSWGGLGGRRFGRFGKQVRQIRAQFVCLHRAVAGTNDGRYPERRRLEAADFPLPDQALCHADRFGESGLGADRGYCTFDSVHAVE